MRIHVNTDSHIGGSLGFSRHVGSIVRDALGRFDDKITRVEIHFSDESSSVKSCDIDKRCLMEARVAGRKPIAVSHQGPSIDQALGGAASKLKRIMDRLAQRPAGNRRAS